MVSRRPATIVVPTNLHRQTCGCPALAQVSTIVLKPGDGEALRLLPLHDVALLLLDVGHLLHHRIHLQEQIV